MIPVPFSSLFFGKYSGWNWRIQSLWTAFQFKGKFILSVSCITAMLFSKTFIGLARSIKTRYSFQWQYLGADLQPLCVEKIIAVWDACFVLFQRNPFPSIIYTLEELELWHTHTAATPDRPGSPNSAIAPSSNSFSCHGGHTPRVSLCTTKTDDAVGWTRQRGSRTEDFSFNI